jgi:hypothetical protein
LFDYCKSGALVRPCQWELVIVFLHVYCRSGAIVQPCQ